MKPWWIGLFIVAGAVVWLVITVAAVIAVLASPRQNAGLALGMALCWTVLVAFAALARRAR